MGSGDCVGAGRRERATHQDKRVALASFLLDSECNRLVTSTTSYNLVARVYSCHPRGGEKPQSSEAQGTHGMTISVNPSVIALVGPEWKSVGGQLLVSGLASLSGCKDLGLRESAWVQRSGFLSL